MNEISIPDDDLREEYDFSARELRSAERGRYARGRITATRLMQMDPDAAGEAGSRDCERGIRDEPA
jgi:hypothetical protein